MSKFNDEQLKHWRNLLDFIEDKKQFRVVTDYAIDMISPLDHEASHQLMVFTNAYFKATDVRDSEQVRANVEPKRKLAKGASNGK